jgi:hypothetical protein
MGKLENLREMYRKALSSYECTPKGSDYNIWYSNRLRDIERWIDREMVRQRMPSSIKKTFKVNNRLDREFNRIVR